MRFLSSQLKFVHRQTCLRVQYFTEQFILCSTIKSKEETVAQKQTSSFRLHRMGIICILIICIFLNLNFLRTLAIFVHLKHDSCFYLKYRLLLLHILKR